MSKEEIINRYLYEKNISEKYEGWIPDNICSVCGKEINPYTGECDCYLEKSIR